MGARDWAEIYARLERDRDDPLAWAALTGRVGAWAWRALGRRGRHVVEDVVADACADAVVGLDRAYGAETFCGFVYGHYLNARRRIVQGLDDDREHTVPLPDWFDVSGPSSDSLPGKEELAALRRCLGGLPGRERRAVALRYLEGVSAAEIGAALGVREANARQLVSRGLARLRRRLADDGLALAGGDCEHRPVPATVRVWDGDDRPTTSV